MATDTYDKQSGLTKRQTYDQLRTTLWNERSSFDAHWRELAEFVFPRRTRFTTSERNKGNKQNQKIVDSTATFAARTLRSGMHAGITSPARPWMKLSVPDPELNEFGPVKEWLHLVSQRMLTVFLKSNLYNALPTIYGDMGVFGTGAMAVLDDERDLFRCYAYPVGSYSLGVSSRQVVDTIIREYRMTIRQVVQEFGLDACSQSVKSLWSRSQYEETIEVCWIVAPNPEHDEEKFGSKYLPFASCHFEKASEEGRFLRESGFREFPVLAPRWDVTGEDIYGTDCPAMTALGDIKQLQMGEKRGAQAVEKMINPPMTGPTSLRNQKASIIPGDITYLDVREGHQGFRPAHEVNFAIDKLELKQQAVRNRISRAFYEDLFLMLAQTDRRQITAREIEERHEEKLLALGPVLERTNDELLDPLVDRVYSMMARAGLIPEPPDELDNVDLKVEYISLMAQAQKLVSAGGHERFLQTTTSLMMPGLFPEIRHKVDINQAVDDLGDMYGISPKWIRPDAEAQERQQQEQQAIAQMQQAEMTKTMSASAKTLSETDTGGDNALTQLLEEVQ